MISFSDIQKNKYGVSLFEAVIAMALFALVAASLVSLGLGGFQGLQYAGNYAQAEGIATEGFEVLRALRHEAMNQFTYTTSSVSFSASDWDFDGEGTTEVIGPYTRIIAIEDVCRDGSDDITTCPGTYTDETSKFVTVTVTWNSFFGKSQTVVRQALITNWDSNDWTQTDWSGGSGQAIWSSSDEYDSDDTNVDVSTAGEVSLVNNGVGCGDYSWRFDSSGDYSFDNDFIEVTGSNAQLVSSSGGGNSDSYPYTSDSEGWVYADWDEGGGEVNVTGTHNASGGNPSGWLDINVPSGKNDEVGGYWYDALVTTSTASSATLSFDYTVTQYDTTPETFQIYAFIDAGSGEPTIGQEVWSSGELTTTASWTGSGSIDVSSDITAAGTYYIKLAVWVETPGGPGTGPFEIGFDNTDISWIGAASYPTSNPSVNPVSGYIPSGVDTWTGFTETASKDSGEIYYQLSNDSGSTWEYWSGSAWVTAGASNYNTASTINTNISSFATSSGSILFRAFLESDGTQFVQLDEVSISCEQSYAWPFTTPSNYTYDPGDIEVTGGVAQLIASGGGGEVFRVQEYYIGSGQFTGNTYTLQLNQDLVSNYFTLVQGSDGNGTNGSNRGPDENYAMIVSDPFGTGDLSTSGVSNEIVLQRGNSVDDWIGVVTVIECISNCTTDGFQLHDIQRVTHGTGNATGSDTSGTAWSDINQVMLFGGFNGPGCLTAENSNGEHDVCHVRIYPSGSDTIEWARNFTANSSESAVQVLEWGSNWTVQRETVTGTNGGNGVNATGEYNTASITSVARDNTWVWGVGYTSDDGIGDSSEGVVITLGDGVNQNASETSVAVGMEYTDSKFFEVYALTHDSLAVDYRFKTDGDSGNLTVDVTVDTAASSTARMALSYNTQNGTGGAFPRPMMSARYTADTTVRLERRRSGQNFAAWVQGIDFSGFNSYASYPTDLPTVQPASSYTQGAVDTWNSFTEISTKNGGEIYYQLSNDDGSTWQYWNGGAWATAGASNYNTASTVNTNISGFATSSGDLLFRAFLESDGTQLVQLDNISVTWGEGLGGGSGYETSGYLVSSAFNMSNASPVQFISWSEDVSCSPSCDIQLQLRTAPDSGGSPGTWTSWTGADGVGTYFATSTTTMVPTSLNDNQWVQYRAELSGDGSVTPILYDVTVNYK
ncbi:MAG: type IV pilus modification PilV family protein [Patescibacteria group bacterium]